MPDKSDGGRLSVMPPVIVSAMAAAHSLLSLWRLKERESVAVFHALLTRNHGAGG
jgi:hypothetical protein